MTRHRRIILFLGDHLDRRSPLLDDYQEGRDLVLMIEARSESLAVWSHKARIALFLSAMRHFAEELRGRGYALSYWSLGDHPHERLLDAVRTALRDHGARCLSYHRPGTWTLHDGLVRLCEEEGVQRDERPASQFLFSLEEFQEWAGESPRHRLEYWYRHARRRTGILMKEGEPLGGRWNYDVENRRAFPKTGPGPLPRPRGFPPDALTQDVLRLVARYFPDHPGSLARFDWPVTSEQAEAALEDFVTRRLVHFGTYQDASWPQEPWLYHSRLSAAMNLGLLHPRRAIEEVVDAYVHGRVSLASTEGFVRQILGWREYVHGLYWRYMPGYLEENALEARLPLPGFYWTAATEMACLRDVITRTLDHGYAHHIERLMILGLFALLYGVHPRAVHEWFLAIYVDAVEWVELPNVLGMSQYADGGRLASKPYVASGHYIARMTGHCASCRYDPREYEGPRACPFNTLYRDFLVRHADLFAEHPRTALQWRRVRAWDRDEQRRIRRQAERLRHELANATSPADGEKI